MTVKFLTFQPKKERKKVHPFTQVEVR